MKVTKLMGLAVILVALAAAMNALAFKTAVVKNPVTLTINPTRSATIAISNPSGTTSSGVTRNDLAAVGQNYMTLTFSDTPQPNSEYTYNSVFAISSSVSGSLTAMTVELTDSSGVPIPGITVTLFKAGGGVLTHSDITGTPQDVNLKLDIAAGASTGDLAAGAHLRITATQAN